MSTPCRGPRYYHSITGTLDRSTKLPTMCAHSMGPEAARGKWLNLDKRVSGPAIFYFFFFFFFFFFQPRVVANAPEANGEWDLPACHRQR